jgi:hypothetical protein
MSQFSITDNFHCHRVFRSKILYRRKKWTFLSEQNWWQLQLIINYTVGAVNG